jgi:c-di-AMP phosphodiesterase-like protein
MPKKKVSPQEKIKNKIINILERVPEEYREKVCEITFSIGFGEMSSRILELHKCFRNALITLKDDREKIREITKECLELIKTGNY